MTIWGLQGWGLLADLEPILGWTRFECACLSQGWGLLADLQSWGLLADSEPISRWTRFECAYLSGCTAGNLPMKIWVMLLFLRRREWCHFLFRSQAQSYEIWTTTSGANSHLLWGRLTGDNKSRWLKFWGHAPPKCQVSLLSVDGPRSPSK